MSQTDPPDRAMKLTILSILLLTISVEALSPLRLKPKWREFIEEIMSEDRMAELNIFGKPVDSLQPASFDKKVIT